MTIGDPYTFETIARVRTDDDVVVQAEDWRDSAGHRTHIAVAVDNESYDGSVTIIVSTAAEARSLKNLFASVERRMK